MDLLLNERHSSADTCLFYKMHCLSLSWSFPPLLYEMMLPPLMSVIGTDHFSEVKLLIPFHSGNKYSFYGGPIMGDASSHVQWPA